MPEWLAYYDNPEWCEPTMAQWRVLCELRERTYESDTELAYSSIGGWWIGPRRVGYATARALQRKVLISKMYDADNAREHYELHKINGWGMDALRDYHMQVAVDELRDWGWSKGQSCHMMPMSMAQEDIGGLHRFAAMIGLKRKWFQETRYPHYDLTVAKRELAVQYGAVEVRAPKHLRALKESINDSVTNSSPSISRHPIDAR